MGIMTRFIKLCKADIHGVMDQLEDKDLLLRQSLREMEEELGRKQAEYDKMIASNSRMKQEFGKYSEEIEKSEKDLATAIEKDRDDIAKFIIRKLKPVVSHKEELGRRIETMDDEISGFKECLETQQRQYEQVRLKSEAFFRKKEHAKWDGKFSGIVQCAASMEPSDEEVELELLRRRESLQKGGVK